MKFLPPDEQVELYKQGFTNDILKRSSIGKALSVALERIEDPVVVALDGRWGTGKTYFLKRWVGAHALENKGKARTLYFDAFAHDYIDDPLIALVGAISELIPSSNKKMKKVKAAAVSLLRPITRVGLAVATSGATEVLGGLGDAAVGAISNDADKALDEFWRKEEGRRAAMSNFRSALSALVYERSATGETIRPLIIVVDELDRCRPDFALALLEIIKHFFSVPHLHFVLGTNLLALENGVKARYGEGIDAKAYLGKFISFTCSLPDHLDRHQKSSVVKTYLDHMGEIMETPVSIIERLKQHIDTLSPEIYISIRDAGKMLSTISLLPTSVLESGESDARYDILFALIVSKISFPTYYPKFISSSISDDEVRFYFGITDQSLLEHMYGKANENYDPAKAWQYKLWSYLRNNGKIEDQDGARDIARSLDLTRGTRNPGKIPQTINQWINILRVG